MKLGICLNLSIFLIALFVFSRCEFSEEQYSLDEDSNNEYSEESRYTSAEKRYSEGGRSYRRRSGGGGGSSTGGGTTGGSGGGSSLSVSVCDRNRAVQSAILCQLIQNGSLNGPSGGCSNINSSFLSSHCASIDQSNLDTLQELRIQDDLEISSSDFSELTNLKYLFLRNVDLDTLPSRAFADLSNLLVLDLSDNELTSPLNDFYSNLSSLEELDLSGNDGINSSDKARIRSAFSGNDDIEIIFDKEMTRLKEKK